jgi:hypothetical protein
MKRKITSALLLFALALTFIGCKKDEDKQDSGGSTPTPTASKTELLIDKNWKLTAWTIDPAADFGNGLTNDLYSSVIEPCEEDDFIKFSADYTMIEDGGTDLCYPDAPQTYPSTWAWSSNQTVLSIGEFDVFDLVELTATTLKVKKVISDSDMNGNPITITKIKTYTKQ